MENKYIDKILEKQANYIDDVTGRAVRHNNTIMHSLSEASAAGLTYNDYAAKHPTLRKQMYKARALTGLGALGVVGAGAYGFHKYTKHKQQQIIDSYNRILNKEAGVIKDLAVGGLNLAGRLTMSAGRTSKSGVKGVAKLGNKALGGHQGGFAENLGMKEELVKKFQGAKNDLQRVHVLKEHFKNADPHAKPGTPERQAHQELLKATGKLKNLSQQRRDAKMALTGLAAIPAYAYHKGKKSSDQNTDTNNYY